MAKKPTKLTDAQKHEKWTELAEARLNKALKQISGLTKLANTRRYGWKPTQIETMKKAFEASLDTCFGAYEGREISTGEVKL